MNGCIQVVEWARACHVFPTDTPFVIHTQLLNVYVVY